MAVKAFPLCCLWSLIHPRALLRLLCFSGSWVSVGYFLFFLLKSYLMCLYLLSLCLFLFNTTSPFSFAAHSHVSFMSFLSSNFLSFHHLFARISHEWFFYVSCCSLFYCWYIFSPSLSVPCCHYAVWCVQVVLLSPSCILWPPISLAECYSPKLSSLMVFVHNDTSVPQVAGMSQHWQSVEVIIQLHCCNVEDWIVLVDPFWALSHFAEAMVKWL